MQKIVSMPQCDQIHRRMFLSDIGMGFTGVALGSLLQRDGVVRGSEGNTGRNQPHGTPKAKQVIWIFLSGGYSQMETFDPKPALNKYSEMTYDETPYDNPIKDPLYQERSRAIVFVDREHSRIFPMQVGFKKVGQSGIEVSDWWPHVSTCVDEMSFVRSMYTTDNDHNAEFQMHHGRHHLDPSEPVIGSWIHYGLGAANENLPAFVFLGKYKDTRVRWNFNANYLGPEHAGVELSLDPENPLPFAKRPKNVLKQEQFNQFRYINQLNRLAAVEYPQDEQIRARIKSYELAFRMQIAAPEALDMSSESEETEQLYGIDSDVTAVYGRRLLAARRLAERGVRYTLVYLSDYGEWDSHRELKKNHARSCERVDKPIAGLLKDLKRRGMMDDTVVVCCTEFGRTPGLEGGDVAKHTGRDHHPHGFTIWMAGAGVKKGFVHGRTDELGFHAVEDPHYVTDLHATVLHLLGIDSRKLNVPGRKRLDVDYGSIIHDILT